MNSLSRREFLKASSLTVAGAALAVGTSVARVAHASGNDEIRVAIIGCGGRGGWIADLFDKHGGYKVVACADYYQDRAAATVA